MGLNCCMDPWLFGFSSMIYGVLMPTGQTLQLFLTPWAASHIAVAPSSTPSLSPTAGRPAPHPRSHQLLPMSILGHLLVSPGDDLLRAATCPLGSCPGRKKKVWKDSHPASHWGPPETFPQLPFTPSPAGHDFFSGRISIIFILAFKK